MADNRVIDTTQWIRDLQTAMRALWPDRPKVYFQATPDMDTPVLTPEEQGQLTRVAQAIAAQRQELTEQQDSAYEALRYGMGAQLAEAEEKAVFDFLNWLAPQNVELHRLTSSGCATAAEGELLERWKTERREG